MKKIFLPYCFECVLEMENIIRKMKEKKDIIIGFNIYSDSNCLHKGYHVILLDIIEKEIKKDENT